MQTRRPIDPPSGPPVALTIAGFDPSGGAGITADVQVFAAHGLFGVSAITAQTVQSTQGVAAVVPQDPELLAQTIQHLQDDLTIAGVKIGILGSEEIVLSVAQIVRKLREKATAAFMPVVLDPVLVSSSGRRLLSEAGVAALQDHLLPLVDWVTPNWAELAELTSLAVGSIDDMRAAASQMSQSFSQLNIVATGGDQERAVDFLRTAGGETSLLESPKIASTSTHGTGCAFSSALLAQLILGELPNAAVAAAKAYVDGAIRHAPGLGKGKGPLNFFWQSGPASRQA